MAFIYPGLKHLFWTYLYCIYLAKDENQIDQENSCQDMFDYNDDSESELIKSESKNSGFSEETATFSCKHCNENFDEARWAPCALKFLSFEMSHMTQLSFF